MQDHPSTPSFCSACGAPLKPGMAFCTGCGRPVMTPQQPAYAPQQPAPASYGAEPIRSAPSSAFQERPMQVLWHLIALLGVGLIVRLIAVVCGSGDAFLSTLSANTAAYAAARAILLGGSLWFLLLGTKRGWLIGALALFAWLMMGPINAVLYGYHLGFRYFLRSFGIALLYALVHAAAAGLSWHFLFARQERDRRAFLSAVIAIALGLILYAVWMLIQLKGRSPVGRSILSSVVMGVAAVAAFLGVRGLSRTSLSGRMRPTALGYVWCGLCLAANLLTLIMNVVPIVRVGMGGRLPYMLTMGLAILAAFILLLLGKKGGWFLLLTVALIQVCSNFNSLIYGAVAKATLPAIFGSAVNAVATWFIMRPSWRAAASTPSCGVCTPAFAAQPTPFVSQAPVMPQAPAVPQVQAEAVPPMRAGAPVQAPAGASLSLCGLRCPQCGSYNVMAKGLSGALGNSLATGLAFGAIGNLVANAGAGERIASAPMEYQCQECKNRFSYMPAQPAPDELLSAPATIEFTRGGNMLGAAVQQFVFLNGIPVGAVKNGQTISFTTNLRYNTLFVTDHFGVAFKDIYRFEALAGMTVPVRFNQKFR